MHRPSILLLSLILISCGTTPSPQERAQTYAEATAMKREGLHQLHYGQTMETVHSHLIESYTPVMDFKSGAQTYSIDSFSVLSPYEKEYGYFLALYENNKLIAVAPEKQIDLVSPSQMMKNYYQSAPRGDNLACERYSSDQYLQEIVTDIKSKKIALGKNVLIKSEEEIVAEIAQKSTEKEKLFTGQDVAELAAMSPFIVFFGPAAVVVGLMATPITVPYAIISEKKAIERQVNTPNRMAEVRNIPLGLSIGATERLESNILLRPNETNLLTGSYASKCTSVAYPLIQSDMQYDVIFFARNDQTFMRIYKGYQGFW